MEIARYWRMNGQRYNLTGSICNCCGKHHFSPRPICDACQGESIGLSKTSGQQVLIPVHEPAHK